MKYMDNREIIAGATEGTLHYLEQRGTDFLKALIGEAAKDVYKGGKSSWTRFKQRNFGAWVNRSAEILDVQRIFPKPVPPSVFVPMAEAAANVDDPTLREMFAQLLARAASGETIAEHPIFRDTLSRMTGNDALMLQIVAQQIDILTRAPDASAKTVSNAQVDGWTIVLAARRYKLETASIDFAMDNLQRLALIRYQGETVDRNAIISIDRLGRQLIELCLPPIPPQPA